MLWGQQHASLLGVLQTQLGIRILWQAKVSVFMVKHHGGRRLIPESGTCWVDALSHVGPQTTSVKGWPWFSLRTPSRLHSDLGFVFPKDELSPVFELLASVSSQRAAL